MIKSMVFIKRKPGLTREEFSQRWRAHADLIRTVPEISRYMRKYIQNHRVPESALPAGMPKSNPAMDFDGIAELTYDSLQDFQNVYSTPRYTETILPDEMGFCDRANAIVYVTTPHVLIAEAYRPPGELSGIKQIVLVKRNPEITREEFAKRWLDTHGPLIVNTREGSRYMRKYVQDHLVGGDMLPDGISKPTPAMDFDGIVEMAYDNFSDTQKSTAALYASETLQAHGRKIADAANCIWFWTSEYVVLDEQHRPPAEQTAN